MIYNIWLYFFPTKLEKRLGYKFKNRALFERSLIHKSYAIKHNKREDNEKLEYLGDAVLGLALGDLLMKSDPSADEGQLSKIRSSLVSTKGLYKKALELGLSREIKTMEKINYESGKIRLLASCFEAIIGAIYLDGGYNQAMKVIQRVFLKNLNQEWKDEDYKTILQGMAQKTQPANLEYKLIKEQGPAHRKMFFVRVLFNKKVLGEGKGSTKKSAEQQAAFYGLKHFSHLFKEK